MADSSESRRRGSRDDHRRAGDFEVPESGVPVYSGGVKVGRTGAYETPLVPPELIAPAPLTGVAPVPLAGENAWSSQMTAPAAASGNVIGNDVGAYPQRLPYAAAPKTNGLAVTALITAILGLNLVSIILGIIALTQIRRTGEAGSAFAIIAIVLGGVMLAALAMFALPYVFFLLSVAG